MTGPLKGVGQHKKAPSITGWCFFVNYSLWGL